MKAIYKLTYTRQDGSTVEQIESSKMQAVRHYLNLLDSNPEEISSLKVWKNETEYTGTLNKFLNK